MLIHMETMIANLINGNLTDAKEQAKRYSHLRIREYMEEVRGASEHEAIVTADYLKGQITFQEYARETSEPMEQ